MAFITGLTAYKVVVFSMSCDQIPCNNRYGLCYEITKWHLEQDRLDLVETPYWFKPCNIHLLDLCQHLLKEISHQYVTNTIPEKPAERKSTKVGEADARCQ